MPKSAYAVHVWQALCFNGSCVFISNYIAHTAPLLIKRLKSPSVFSVHFSSLHKTPEYLQNPENNRKVLHAEKWPKVMKWRWKHITHMLGAFRGVVNVRWYWMIPEGRQWKTKLKAAYKLKKKKLGCIKQVRSHCYEDCSSSSTCEKRVTATCLHVSPVNHFRNAYTK